MGHRDAGEGRSGDGRSDARHHLERDARQGARQRLLAASSEHERIAALEPNDALSLSGPIHQQGIDGLLIDGGLGRRLPRVDELRP